MAADISLSSDELAEAPALAMLALLEHALKMTEPLLLAVHAEIADLEEIEVDRLSLQASAAVAIASR